MGVMGEQGNPQNKTERVEVKPRKTIFHDASYMMAKKRGENKAIAKAVAAKKAALSKNDLTTKELKGKLDLYEKKLQMRYASMKQAAKKLAKAKKDALVRKNALLKGLHAVEKGH